MSNLRGLKLHLEKQRPWTDVDLKDPLVLTGQRVIVNCGPELQHAQGPTCDQQGLQVQQLIEQRAADLPTQVKRKLQQQSPKERNADTIISN